MVRTAGATRSARTRLLQPEMETAARAAPDRSVVLLHDGYGDRSATVSALEPILRALAARGFTFVTP